MHLFLNFVETTIIHGEREPLVTLQPDKVFVVIILNLVGPWGKGSLLIER